MLRNVTDMDLRLLRIFSIVVKCGGFTAAQAELNMSQSNISTHISSLEKRLGYRICERGKGGFRLTEKGQRILKASSALFGAVDAFRDEAQDLAGRLVGDLYLGLADNIATLPAARIDAAIARFYQREHDMHLHIFVNSPTELERAVIDGQLDMAISYFSRPLPTLAYQPLYSEEIGIFCGLKHPLFSVDSPSLEQLRACDWITHGFLPADQVLPVAAQRASATAHHMEAVAHGVLAGTHLGYLPAHYARPWLQSGQMRALHPETLHYEVQHSMITHVGHPQSEAVRAFVSDLLAEHGL
ncbi:MULTISPECIES: LysR family transcriptional regulator [unclassified Pseudomonas]|uniref:LysR family transcriptional regulator n=1 Tax=unclassified Pseudomonas TaxID=196821 RepID=UPI00069E0E16|nr:MULTISPECIES: LysR family transcriptional regulator [unclassified Pseudomonas]WPN44813.1 LysR family transcriptional regulator [Pseudomonas sp. P8_241]